MMNKETIYKLIAIVTSGDKNREKHIPYIIEKTHQAINSSSIALDEPNEDFFEKLMNWDNYEEDEENE